MKKSTLGTIRLLALQLAAFLVVGTAAASPAQAETAGVIVYEQFEGSGTNHQSDIWMMNPDGTGQTNLTNTPESQEYDPELSPDGSKVTFISNRPDPSNEDGNYEIFTLALDGSELIQVTNTLPPNEWETYSSYDPTWSPDATRIAFSGIRQWSSVELFVINSDGSGGETKLTDPSDFAGKWDPDWSPDGSKILFTWGFAHAFDLHTINTDGTEETNLTPDPDEDSYSAERNGTWSPDGTRIAFDTDRHCCGNYPNPNTEIYVMEYPSGQLTRVTDDGPFVHNESDQPQDEDPTWSLDASQIVFTSDRDGGYDLFVVDAPPVPSPAKTASMLSFFAGAAADPDPQPLNTAAGDQQDPFWGVRSSAPLMRDLTVTRAGTGSGRVTSSPAGIDCGRDCSEDYAAGTEVTLTAKPASDSTFAGWNGACSGTAATCQLTMSEARSVTATFAKSSGTGLTLTLSRDGTGAGKVTSSPAGIDCGTDCSEVYPSGSEVTLTAKARRGSSFAGWSGACTGTATTCTVTMKRGDKAVRATFSQA